jgi:hypothetical protein
MKVLDYKIITDINSVRPEELGVASIKPLADALDQIKLHKPERWRVSVYANQHCLAIIGKLKQVTISRSTSWEKLQYIVVESNIQLDILEFKPIDQTDLLLWPEDADLFFYKFQLQ